MWADLVEPVGGAGGGRVVRERGGCRSRTRWAERGLEGGRVQEVCWRCRGGRPRRLVRMAAAAGDVGRSGHGHGETGRRTAGKQTRHRRLRPTFRLLRGAD